jgi:nucleoside 2-deoxyribosyltransferase
MRRRLYIAAPLFSEAERAFNERLESALSFWLDVFLPQRDGDLITDLIDKGMSAALAKDAIFKTDLSAIKQADIVLAVLDGASIDEGVAVEAALGFAWGKECWALKTDFRSLSSFGDNPMVEGLIDKYFNSLDAITDHLSEMTIVESSLTGSDMRRSN